MADELCAAASSVPLNVGMSARKLWGAEKKVFTRLSGVGSREAHVPLINYESNSLLPNLVYLLDWL